MAWAGNALVDRHGLASSFATRQFIRQIERIQPDVIHIHNIHGYFLNYRILFEYLSKCNIPVVWTVHDCWLYTGHCYYYSYVNCNRWQDGCGECPQRKEFPASLWIDRSRQNYLDKKQAFTSMPQDKLVIVPVSNWIKSEMQKSFFCGYNFQVIHNGINTEVFRVYDAQEVREKYGLGDKHVLLGVASIWSREKGLDDFIQMAALLKKEELIVGGTPVVTYRTGGSVEAVTDETGFIVEQGNYKELLEAARMIRQRGKSYYQSRCREYALMHFKKEDRYSDYIRLYDELTKRG